MAYTQADITALKDAIKTGAKRVKFGAGPDARETEFRSLDEMKQTLADMISEVEGTTVPNRTVGAYFSGL